MTRKKAKKNNKATSSSVAPNESTKKEKEDDLDMLEDIKRDEDLYISENDVNHIKNFIRTTNKSFNSLGNSFVEKFANRCSLVFLHALNACFDPDSEDRDDIIRRLNIIYIIWRLPELEPELRMKPQKNMNDVYNHPYSTFLFYAEQLEKHKIEAKFARIIVTNNVHVIEKLTAPDFIQKAYSLDVNKVDLDALEKWTEANTDHWPEVIEQSVPLAKAMREIGLDRQDYEAGMAETFYPIQHNAPTMLPPKMEPLETEDPLIYNYRKDKNLENKEIDEVVYSLTAGDDMQEKLKQAFMDLEQSIVEYQCEVFSGMTPDELAEAQKEIVYDGHMSESSDSEFDDLSDSEDCDSDLRSFAMTEDWEINDEVIQGCIDRLLDGTTLTSAKVDRMIHFLRIAKTDHPQFQRLLQESETDANIVTFMRTNKMFAAAFLQKMALDDSSSHAFKRCLHIAQTIGPVVSAIELVLKMATTFMTHRKMTPEHREAVLDYVRHTVKACDEDQSARTVRLVAMLVQKLLNEQVVSVEEIAADVKPFTLKHSENRECTGLYQLMTGSQTGDRETTTTTSKTSKSSATTTTTTTSQTPNALSTTTTTTVVKKCGPAVIKQTSRKVVLQFETTGEQIQGKAMAMLAAIGRPISSPNRERLERRVGTEAATSSNSAILSVKGRTQASKKYHKKKKKKRKY